MLSSTHSKRFPRQLLWTGALLLATSVVLVLMQGRLPGLGGAREAGVGAVMPLMEAGESAAQRSRTVWQNVFAPSELAAENEALRAELAVIEAELHATRVQLAELQQETGLAAEFPREAPRTKTARVIAPVLEGRSRRLWIALGRADGIAPGQAVLGPRGIVGTVREVFDQYAIVLLVTDETSKWGGEVAERAELGIVHGTGSGETVEFRLEKTTTDIEPGDIVRTSGMKGSLAPAGLPFGVVREVSVDETGERRAVLNLPHRPEDLRHVFVLDAKQIPWEAPR